MGVYIVIPGRANEFFRPKLFHVMGGFLRQMDVISRVFDINHNRASDPNAQWVRKLDEPAVERSLCHSICHQMR